MTLSAQLGAWLTQAAAPPLPSTFVTWQEPGWWFGWVAQIAWGIVGILLVLTLPAIFYGVWQVRAVKKRAMRVLDRLEAQAGPVARTTGKIVDNVEHITTAVRGDVGGVSDTVHEVNARLRRVLALAERRVRRFDALLQVVQDEAEDTIVSAAATMRGVRASADAFGREAEEMLAGELPADEEWDDDESYLEEMDDGDDDARRSIRRGARPRIRPRGGRHGAA